MEDEDELDLSDPPGGGNRLQWHELPQGVRQAIEEGIGSHVTHAQSQPGGFSPGVAARLSLTDGRLVFLKVVGSDPNPHSPELHRREARIAAALPAGTPTPRLICTYDDGTWVALVFENVEGSMPTIPWREEELARVLSSLADLARALTPSPVEAPPIQKSFEEFFSGWRTLVRTESLHPRLDDWSRANLQLLADLEGAWERSAEGNTLLHADIRADNLLLTRDGVVVVDWPHAAIGAAWLDLLFMLPSVHMQGGPPPWHIFDSHPLAVHADPDAVTSVVAALAGYFTNHGLRPDPPGLPTVRRFQRAQGAKTLQWIRQRIR